MPKLFRAEALETLESYTRWSGPEIAKAYRGKLKTAFRQARSSKMNVYLPLHIGEDIVRFEIKGVHLKKRTGKYHAPYAQVVIIDEAERTRQMRMDF